MNAMNVKLVAAVLGTVALVGCGSSSKPSAAPSAPATITVTSPAFANGSAIPRDFTCDGTGHTPPLRLEGVPASRVDLALTMTDPDASNFVHWVTWGSSLGGAPAHLGKNSAGVIGYTGPCPPPGPAHHYVVRVYALNTRLSLPDGASAAQLLAAIEGHVIAQGQLVGTYARTR